MFGPKYSKEEYDGVVQQLSNQSAINLRLEADLEEAQDVIETTSAVNQQLTQQINQHQQNLVQLKQTHAKELEQVKQTVERRVNQHLASIGVNQFASEIYSDVAQKSDQELLMQLNSLPVEKRSEFYQKHKEALTRACL